MLIYDPELLLILLIVTLLFLLLPVVLGRCI